MKIVRKKLWNLRLNAHSSEFISPYLIASNSIEQLWLSVQLLNIVVLIVLEMSRSLIEKRFSLNSSKSALNLLLSSHCTATASNIIRNFVVKNRWLCVIFNFIYGTLFKWADFDVHGSIYKKASCKNIELNIECIHVWSEMNENHLFNVHATWSQKIGS